MTAWTRTAPTTPGHYWIRWPGHRAWMYMLDKHGRWFSIGNEEVGKGDSFGAEVEFWPVAIEEPA